MSSTPTHLWIPTPALEILRALQAAGFEAYLVGGSVRDLVQYELENPETAAQTPPTATFDLDFTTNATPEQIQELFSDSFYENEFGTVGVPVEVLTTKLGVLPPSTETSSKQRIIDLSRATKIHTSLKKSDTTDEQQDTTTLAHTIFEVTTYRSKELYEHGYRRPSSLSWGSSIQEDLERRDFTCNALALTVTQETAAQKFPTKNWWVRLQSSEFSIIDTTNGLEDLTNHILRCVGDPVTRFEEDALRLLRAIRFAVQLNVEIEEKTLDAVYTQHHLLEHISWERIRDEFLKILTSPFPAEGIELLDDTGLLDHILPELQLAKGVTQGGHHTTDVWTHSLDALRYCPSSDPIVRLATLIHDIAKPATRAEQNGTITFYNHELIGARMAKEIGRRLKLSKDAIDRLFILVRHHMFYYQPHNTDASIRRFMRKVGLEYVDDILDVREGDRLGSGARKTSWRLEEMKQRMIEQLNQPMDVTDLAIDGHDLMTELSLKPGPQLGVLLNQLFQEVLENPELNTKEELLKLAHRYFENGDSSPETP